MVEKTKMSYNDYDEGLTEERSFKLESDEEEEIEGEPMPMGEEDFGLEVEDDDPDNRYH